MEGMKAECTEEGRQLKKRRKTPVRSGRGFLEEFYPFLV